MNHKKGRNRKAEPELQPIAEIKSGLSHIFDIPQTALAGIPQIEMAGNREAIVEGCQGVLEYDENIIRLSTGKMSIRFMGRGLQIRVLTRDSAVVEGFITHVEFIT